VPLRAASASNPKLALAIARHRLTHKLLLLLLMLQV
jgi:hypothetical protein